MAWNGDPGTSRKQLSDRELADSAAFGTHFSNTYDASHPELINPDTGQAWGLVDPKYSINGQMVAGSDAPTMQPWDGVARGITDSEGFFGGLGTAFNDMKGGLSVMAGPAIAQSGIFSGLGGMGGAGAAEAGSQAMPFGENGILAGQAGASAGGSGVSSMFNPMNMTGTGFTGNLADYGMGQNMFGNGGSMFGAEGAAAASAGQNASQGGFLDWLTQAGQSMSNPVGGNPFGVTGKDLFTGALNYGLNSSLASQARSGANTAANRGDALLQPQRAPFQQAANDMVQNPSSYFQNNPFATSMANFYKNSVIPSNVAKSGNSGFDTDRLGAQFATAVGGNYNDLLAQLQGFGGYNQSPGYSGLQVGQGNQLALGFNSEANRGIGKIASSIFGDPTAPKTPQVNPTTGSSTVMN